VDPQVEACTLMVEFIVYPDDLFVKTSKPVEDKAVQEAILRAVLEKLQ
jgi:hypothetical protein